MTTKANQTEIFKVDLEGMESTRIAANSKRGYDHMMSMAENQARNICKRERKHGVVVLTNEKTGDVTRFEVTSLYQIAKNIN